jgi:hypothetical protein
MSEANLNRLNLFSKFLVWHPIETFVSFNLFLE